MSRRPAASIVASPVLVGAVTVLVAIVAVFLAYNANNGLPFVPVYRVSVDIPNGARATNANEIRIGGTPYSVIGLLEKQGNVFGFSLDRMVKIADPTGPYTLLGSLDSDEATDPLTVGAADTLQRAAQLMAESGFNPRAVSPAGARGRVAPCRHRPDAPRILCRGCDIPHAGGVIEVNAVPGLRMHLAPVRGRSRDVGDAIVRAMFRLAARHPKSFISLGLADHLLLDGEDVRRAAFQLRREVARVTGRTMRPAGRSSLDPLHERSDTVDDHHHAQHPIDAAEQREPRLALMRRDDDRLPRRVRDRGDGRQSRPCERHRPPRSRPRRCPRRDWRSGRP